VLTERQQQWRKHHIGASESPAICGVSPWQSANDIYWRKVADVSDEETSEAMETGRRLEDALIDYACEKCGIKGIRRNQFRVAKREPILAATCDALGDGVVIEAKTSSYPSAWGEPFTDEVPDHVMVQVQHQLFVTDAEVAFVPTLLAGSRFEWRIYRITRHEKLIDAIVSRCVAFWRAHVEPRIPPADEPPPIDILRAQPRQHKRIALPDEASRLVDEYLAIQQKLKDLEREKVLLMRRLISLLEDADEGITPDGKKVSYKLSKRTLIDTTELRTKYPEIAAAVAETIEYRALRIGETKNER
jgi:putative phage-type endonuclease